MSPYVAAGIGLAFLGWSGFMYYEGASKEIAVCGKSDAQHDLAQTQVTVAAQQHVITTVQKQTDINQGAENAFQTNVSGIDSLYSGAIGMQSTSIATSNDISPIPAAASRVAPAICSGTSKKYKLTPQQCDTEEAKFNALWNAWVAQAALK